MSDFGGNCEKCFYGHGMISLKYFCSNCYEYLRNLHKFVNKFTDGKSDEEKKEIYKLFQEGRLFIDGIEFLKNDLFKDDK